MNRAYPASASTIVVARHPIHSLLAAFPVACFTLALVNDIAYWQSSDLIWKHFAEWLLLYGIVGGSLSLVAGILDTLLRRRVRVAGPAWPGWVGSVVVLVLAIINSLVHSGDGWTGVVPYGLVLSAATAIIVLAVELFGRPLAYRLAPE